MTVDEALCHPYLASYVRLICVAVVQHVLIDFLSQHDPEDEPVVAPLSASYFEFDCRLITCLFSA